MNDQTERENPRGEDSQKQAFCNALFFRDNDAREGTTTCRAEYTGGPSPPWLYPRITSMLWTSTRAGCPSEGRLGITLMSRPPGPNLAQM